MRRGGGGGGCVGHLSLRNTNRYAMGVVAVMLARPPSLETCYLVYYDLPTPSRLTLSRGDCPITVSRQHTGETAWDSPNLADTPVC